MTGSERPALHRVSLGTGSPEGENSAYVLPSRRVVVDPGPPTAGAWDRLVVGIADAGLALADVEHVLVTHWHVDHAGLAPRLAREADATVAMGERDAPLVGAYAVTRQERLARDRRRLREWGVPADVVSAVVDGDEPSPIPDEFPVRALADGERVAGVEAVATPGHTLGHVAFVVREADAPSTDDADARPAEDLDASSTDDQAAPLLVGDLVLPTYTPNVGGGDTRLFEATGDEGPGDGVTSDEVPEDGPAGVVAAGVEGPESESPSDPLSVYLGSLDRVERVVGADREGNADPVVAYPGHGAALDLRERAAEIRDHHRTRTERVRDVVEGVDDPAGVTPWRVARRLFGEMAGIHAKMGAGEAAAHLERLRAEGVVALGDAGDSVTARYRLASEGG